MSLAHGMRIGAFGIALLAVAGFGGGGVAMPDRADARVASAKAELPPFNFEIRTLSNRADLISDGDALVEVQVPKTVPMKKVTLTLNGADVGASFVADESGAHLARRADRAGPGREHLRRRLQRQRQRPARGPASRSPTTSRGGPDPARLADAAVDLRHAHAGARIGQHAGVQRERPDHVRGRCAVQHRHRVQAVLPHDDGRLARPRCRTRARRRHRRRTTASSPTRPAPRRPTWRRPRRRTGLTVPYIVRVERGTMNRGIYDIAVLFDPSKPWTALAPQPQWNGKVVYTFGASTGQPRLQFRTEQNWADDAGAVARLHGGRQQPHRLALQLQPRRSSPRR